MQPFSPRCHLLSAALPLDIIAAEQSCALEFGETMHVNFGPVTRKVNDLFLGPVFFYFLVLPSSLSIKGDSAALYVMKRRGWAHSLRLIRPRSARICTQIRGAKSIS